MSPFAETTLGQTPEAERMGVRPRRHGKIGRPGGEPSGKNAAAARLDVVGTWSPRCAVQTGPTAEGSTWRRLRMISHARRGFIQAV